jgi:hypothetical protein
MKKWGILAVVVLCGLLLALQFLSKKNTLKTSAPAPAAAASEEIGVALPAAATGYISPEAPKAPETAAVPRLEGAGSYNDLMLPALSSPYEGACPGGSLDEIRATHGRYWGYFAKNIPFSFKDTQKMYGYVASYVACSALARGSEDLCGSLPGEASVGDTKIAGNMSVSYQCKAKASPLLFRGYLTGKNKTLMNCYSTLDGMHQKAVAKLSVNDLCEAASNGLLPLRKYLIGAIPGRDRKIKALFPDSRAECGGDQECLDNFAVYTAMKDGTASECPRGEDKPLCEAAILHSAESCGEIVRDMSVFYCATVAKVKKANGGRIGMTPKEIQAEVDRTKAEKKQADQEKAANEKKQAEINAKIKRMLGGE